MLFNVHCCHVIEALRMIKMFIKYPSIKHLPGSQMSREDKRVSPEELEILRNTPLHVSEKVDGATVAIGIKNGAPQLFKRSGAIGTGEHVQYQDFKSWVFSNMDRIQKIPEEFLIYGEWLSVRHSVSYDKLPEFFLAFDVLGNGCDFAPVDVGRSLLRNWGFSVPCEISDLSLGNIEQIASRLSHYSTYSYMEGVIVRNNFSSVDLSKRMKTKWVRESFIQGEHWSKGNVERNQLREGV